ncbi:MAG TPA: glycine cleavage system protein GcvH [Chloroflexota bacterium]
MTDDFPGELRYTETDEWVRLEGEEAVSGITSFASDQLGDVVYLQLPEVGRRYGKADAFGEIESVKAVSDLYSPVSGEVLAVNEELDQNPGLINEDPYGRGWIARLRPDNLEDVGSLLDAAAYERNTLERL